MKKIIVAFISVCWFLQNTTSSFAQIKLSPDFISFGEVQPITDRVADVLIENYSGQQVFVLRTDISAEFDFRYTTKTIEPDSTVVLRIKFRPREKKNYNEKILLHFSNLDKPLTIHITANVQYVDAMDNLPCPDFSERAAECCPTNMFMAEVVDAATKKPISQATIEITEQRISQLKMKTSSDGLVSQFVPIGYYDLVASAKGYESQTITSYVNKQHHFFRFELKKIAEEEILPITEPVEEPVVEIRLEQEKDSVQSVAPIIESAILPESKYSANNIVFLVDVSQSMDASNKMDLMKISLVELTEALRPIDKMGLVTYATTASLLLPSTNGDHKGEITSIIQSLDAGGSTSGAKGLKKAFELNKKNIIVDGNNQVIVITDGAFLTEDQKAIEKLVKKYNRKKIRLSVVGIKSTDYAVKNLLGYATLGSGSFVAIDDENDSRSTLIEEIKRMSAK